MLKVDAQSIKTGLATINDNIMQAQNEGRGDDDFVFARDVSRYVHAHRLAPELAPAMVAVYYAAASETNQRNHTGRVNADDGDEASVLADVGKALNAWVASNGQEKLGRTAVACLKYIETVPTFRGPGEPERPQ
jgi:hypothetical protein